MQIPTFLLAGAIAAGVVGEPHVAHLYALYQAVYPSDPARRHALDLCILRDPTFDRLDRTQRDDCYREELGSLPDSAAQNAKQLSFIDRWRASGEGHLPANDIRSQELDDSYLNINPSQR